MAVSRRFTADFNHGGLVGDEGRVYLDRDTLEQIKRAGVTLEVGMRLTLCDHDADDQGRPTWLVVEGAIGRERHRWIRRGDRRWYVDYCYSNVRWEPRGT